MGGFLPAVDVFLSYSRADSERARLFATALEEEGLKVWWDNVIRSGQAFDEQIEIALRTAKAVVVLWSENSVASRWVRAEATFAERRDILVPCMIEACERPIAFELIQSADLRGWSGATSDPTWRALVEEISSTIGGGAKKASKACTRVEAPREFARSSLPSGDKLIAVLPFDNLSTDGEMAYFSDGISEDILGRVSSGSELKVVGRALSFQFRGTEKAKAAQALGASHLVDGSIRRAGNKVRIFAHLTEVESLTTLWSEHYDRDLDDIFTIQDEISEAIAQALDAAFSPSKAPKIDPLAYDLYLQLRQLMYRSMDLEKFESLSAGLVRMAPEFADGWALRALILSWQSHELPYNDRDAIIALGKGALERALSIDPKCPNAIAAEWSFYSPFGQFVEQGKLEEKWSAMWEQSGIANVHHPFHLECVGRKREAIALMQEYRARKAYVADSYLGMAIWRAGQFAKGREMLEQALAAEPGDYNVRATLIGVYTRDNDRDALDQLLDPDVLRKYSLGQYAWAADAGRLALSGSTEAARTFLEDYTKRQTKFGSIEPFLLALWSDLGFTDEGYRLAETVRLGPSGNEGDVLGENAYRPHLLFSSAYPQLRQDRRFVKLCARLGLVEYWLETGSWPDCADEVSYDFQAECERYRYHPKDRFLPIRI